MGEDPADASAAALHVALVEVLKQLNRADVEDDTGEGLEPAEILAQLRRGPLPNFPDADLDRAVATLVANQMAELRETEHYAWDRARVLGRRYRITLAGKQFLVQQIDKSPRID